MLSTVGSNRELSEFSVDAVGTSGVRHGVFSDM
jgi:hypothetical protein